MFSAPVGSVSTDRRQYMSICHGAPSSVPAATPRNSGMRYPPMWTVLSGMFHVKHCYASCWSLEEGAERDLHVPQWSERPLHLLGEHPAQRRVIEYNLPLSFCVSLLI